MRRDERAISASSDGAGPSSGWSLISLERALAGLATARLTHGPTSDYAEAVGRIGLAAFAYLELTDGANWLRRLVGAAVLAALIQTLAQSAR